VPENLLALKSVADIHCEAEAFSLARSYYRQVLQRDRYNSEAREGSKRNSKLAEEPTEETKEDTAPSEPSIDESALNDSEREVFNTVTLAELYKNQGHTKLAREICDSILRDDPENKRVREILEQLGS
jgi:tetratricopeptide (TPR) repeat protein